MPYSRAFFAQDGDFFRTTDSQSCVCEFSAGQQVQIQIRKVTSHPIQLDRARYTQPIGIWRFRHTTRSDPPTSFKMLPLSCSTDLAAGFIVPTPSIQGRRPVAASPQEALRSPVRKNVDTIVLPASFHTLGSKGQPCSRRLVPALRIRRLRKCVSIVWLGHAVSASRRRQRIGIRV